MINEPLIRQTMDYIEQHPEEWDQGDYENRRRHTTCGTTRCFAGWAIALYHGEFESIYYNVLHKNGKSASQYAAELLGLSPDQADSIFMFIYPTNIDAFKRRVTRVTGVEFKTDDNTNADA